ncbi:MAG: VCBS repeat-containing protein [Chlorobi bacterium]|nr:VCBS repeat-containing protein [Chlorobiota bacterium]
MLKYLISIILFLNAFLLNSQTFTDIQAGLTGVSESASNWIDYDQDGDLDIFVCGEFYKPAHGIKTKLYRNIRNDRFTEVYTPIANVYRGDFDWADYNLDGIPDIFIIGQVSSGKSIAYLYKGNRTTNFIRIPVNIKGVKDGSVEWGDFDRDGDQDLLIVGQEGGNAVSKIYRNDRNNKFTDIGAQLPGVAFGVGRWCDFDLDGDLDVIVSGTENSGMVITALFRNDNNRFTNLPLGFSNLRLSDIAWGDYDNDGDQDFAMNGETQNGKFVTKIYNNNLNLSFVPAFPDFVNVRSGSVDWGDMDHDGDLDLLVTGEFANGAVSKVYRNERNEMFTDINAQLIGLYMSDGHWGDYDNDGDLDIVISGMSNDYEFVSKVYRNDPIRTDTIKKRKTDIWNNTVVIPERPKPIYFYVYSSCYCDLDKDGIKEYNAFISLIKRPKAQYEMENKFNGVIHRDYPNWEEFDQGNIIQSGFSTYQKAVNSRFIAIDEYKSKNFKVHDVKW